MEASRNRQNILMCLCVYVQDWIITRASETGSSHNNKNLNTYDDSWFRLTLQSFSEIAMDFVYVPSHGF